jgi:hypothetical protein
MEATVESSGLPSPRKDVACISEPQSAAILRELENILNSRAFRPTKRSQQFLSYVVKQTLEGHAELLKERTIGVELFRRPASYSTGDDGVVRVLAGEVRRRLERYYHEQAASSLVRIELPVGSYVPEFRDNRAAPSIAPEAPRLGGNRRRLRLATVTALGLGAVLILVLISPRVRSGKPPDSVLDQFWSPVFATSQPVLICVAKPVVYRPSPDLYRMYSKTHPTEFGTEVDRYDRPLLLDPKQMIAWAEMVEAGDFGVALGDVYVAAQLSALFARINKPSQVRIGSHYSFEDLRNSPAVLVGAYNNRWTLQMTSSLRFVFAEDERHASIEDRSSPGKVWSIRVGPRGESAEDYGIVTRLLDSKTGQVLIAVAGIGEHGTQAAGDSISGPQHLREALRTAPPDWQKKNLQVVVQASVIDNVAGPPRVVATNFW